MRKNYFVYIVSNKLKTTFYIGVTNNLERRIYEHKNKLINGFSKKYNLTELIYFEKYQDINEAIRREKQLKNWHRSWKINLIKKVNPKLEDLSYKFKYKKIEEEIPSDSEGMTSIPLFIKTCS